MFAQDHTFSPSLANTFQEHLPIPKMEQGWTSRRMDFGEAASNEPSSMSRFLTHMLPSNPTACYRKHEKTKKRAYEQRILEVYRTLLVYPSGDVFNRRLGTCCTHNLQTTCHPPRSQMGPAVQLNHGWLRCRLPFSLLRGSIQAIGARSASGRASKSFSLPIDLMIIESKIDT